MGTHSRRRFLELAGVGTAAALAGCSAGDEEPATTDPGRDDSETTTSADDGTTTTDPTTMSTIFHFSSPEEYQDNAVSNVENLLEDESTDVETVELVANGAGIGLLTDDSTVEDRVQSLVEGGVTFKACENTMEGKDVSKDDLLPGVETVPAGVGELTKRQADGYAYIKTP